MTSCLNIEAAMPLAVVSHHAAAMAAMVKHTAVAAPSWATLHVVAQTKRLPQSRQLGVAAVAATSAAAATHTAVAAILTPQSRRLDEI